MKKIFIILVIAWIVVIFSKNATAQYCTAGTSVCDEYIASVVCGSINNSSSCSSGGYANYTTLSTNITMGVSQSITVTNGTFYSGDYVDVWIDLNHNSSFTDAGEQVVHYAQTGAVTSTSFTVPTTATSGSTRMRICVSYYSTTSSCGTTYYGEYEDYTVNLISPTPPNAPTVTASSTTLSCGGSSTLTATSTTTGIIIRWWDSSTGGNMLCTTANGGTYIVTPSGTSTYYAESYNGGTASTTRTSVTITVSSGTLPNPVVTANPVTICATGASSNLVGTGAGNIRWWTASSGGTMLGSTVSSAIFVVTPTVTTIYYADAYAICGTSASRVPDTVFVSGLASPVSLISSPSTTISCGSQISLSASSTSNYINWYTTATGGTPIGTSENGTNLPLIPPSSSMTYYAEAANGSPNGGQTFNYTGSIVTWSVPSGVSSITVTAAGASGGFNSNTGGRGAIMTGNFAVTPGQVLSILVGQCPGSSSLYPGGGGGTFVASGSTYSSATPLIVGGGGGGGYSSSAGIDAPTSQAGTYTSVSYLGANGNGAIAAPCVGGGGGFYSSGAADTYYSYAGGGGFQQGGSGGCGNNAYGGSSYQCGGFGGGTAGDYWSACNTFGGNGGGYSGGSGYNTTLKYYGEAGGSFNGGTNQTNLSGTSGNTGNGYVIITWNAVFCTSAVRSSITITVNPPLPPLTSSNPGLVCSGQVSSFIGTGAIGIIRWWTAPSGGTMIATTSIGGTLIVTPTIATIYYAEVYATCGTSTRTGDTVMIGTLSPPSLVSATPTTLNCGVGSSSLSGTTLAQNIAWYDAPTSGNLIGNSVNSGSLTVFPISTTVYYAESQNLYQGSQTFSYTGSQQTFTVPAGLLSVQFDVQGAQGGTYSAIYGVGGNGGRVITNLSVIPGQLFYVNVGGQGSWSSTSPYGAGWNGGGAGGYSSYYGGGGGGASDIRTGGSNLTNIVIVAGGGGGASGYTGYYNGNGGAGGDQVGGYGLWYGSYYTYYCGLGGSQNSGGSGGSSGGSSGTLGAGGDAYATYGGGGGGGGYYGGGGGYYYGGGGGGSNYYSPTGTSNVITYQGYTSGNGQVVISWYAVSCSSTSRSSVTVTVNSISSPPSNVTASPSTIICGDISNINATSSGYTIGWFTTLTGGNRISTSTSGSNYPVSPTSTTTYYAEAESIISGTLTFLYTGAVQSWVVPINTNSIGVDVQGAAGGTYSSSYGTGGQGGRVQANVSVVPGEQLYFYVGQQGTYYTTYTGVPSFNGGGLGSWSSYYGGDGGGGSDIRTSSGSLSSILVVAGGGGGANGSSGYSGGNGGAGGGLTGGNGLYSGAYNSTYSGAGGTQTGGGLGGDNPYGGGYGILGVGGNAYYYYGGGGGGGGYYGGGGGYEYGGAGGGSSWTSPSCTSVIHTQGYTTGNGQIIISWNTIQCASTRTPVTLTVNTPPNPSTVIALPSIISCGGASNLSATTTNGIIRWWSATIGGSLLGNSVSGGIFSVYPQGATTVYYAESYTTCTSQLRVPDTVYFSTTIGPVAVASPSTICTGSISNLVGVAPGNLIRWFDSPYGGTLLATEQSGANYTVLPTTATTYYAEGYIGSSGSVTFNYTTSNYVTWIVPLGAMSVNIDAGGAQGGTYSLGYGNGGQGGRVQTTLNTIPGQILYINIGQAGQSSVYGGWWGGGNGGSTNSAGGGGGTDIRIGGTNISNRVIVAGAGGGNCGYSAGTNSGGAGGGLIGGNGLYSNSYTNTYCGGGGTQSSGGYAATYTSYIANPGILGKGGSQTGMYGGGGGGGYYGGGAGSYYGGGGGGSSWTDPNLTSNTTHIQGYFSGNGQVTISWNVAPCTGGRTAVSVNIGTPSDPTSVTVTPTSVSCGGTVSLNASTNGFLATWWDSPSGGNLIGTSLDGVNYNIVPTASTTYYVESDAFYSVTQTYGYTGNVQTLTVPSGVTTINVDASGAQGSSYDTTIGVGGYGGRVQTILSVSSGQVLYLRIGGHSLYNTSGWNGGGCGSGCSGLLGGGGGGATDIRIGGITLANRVVVAGGGGGGGYGTSVISCNGGCGGSLVAGNGSYNGAYDATKCGSGGTQSSGGISSTGGGTSGSLGTGGVSAQNFGEGGGGGGYYGGGGGSTSGGGGGGSSWTDPNLTTNTIHTQCYQVGNGMLTLTWNSISCNSADRISVSISVTPIANPTSVTASPSSINCSSGSTISASTSVGIIRWWSASTGGTLFGSSVSGAIVTVYPSLTTVYYAETYQSPCVSASRLSLTLTVVPIASPTATATPPSYCTSGTSNLNAVAAGDLIRWWTAYTGGTMLSSTQSGSNYAVSPTTTTIFYAEASQFNTGSVTFSYSGSYTTWNVPLGATTVAVDVAGAQGSVSASTTYGTGGLGGRVQTNLSVTPGQLLYIYVGGMPSSYSSPGGFNGGGNGSGYSTYYGGSGGDASDIRTGLGGINDRVVIAGGGGGSGYGSGTCTGGAGGGPTIAGAGLYSGSNNTTYCGQGGSLAGGGAAATYTSYPASGGGLGFGGAAATYYGGGGGGGGYFGGGGGSYYGGGGGGSSYVNTAITSSTVHTQGYQTGNGYVTVSWNVLQCISNRTSVSVTVNINSTVASSASASPSAVCTGSSTTLSVNGGNLSPGATWNWYKGACGGSAPTAGNPIIITPTANATYYVRAQGSCNTTACVSTIITMNVNSVTSDSVSVNPAVICIGSGIAISRNGGSLGTGGRWSWYTGSCGGTFMGTGLVITDIPQVNTTYYLRVEGQCNTTTCKTKTVIVNTNSVIGTSATTTPSTVCSGSVTTLMINGGQLGTGGSWHWYTGSCGGTVLGIGSTIIDNPVVSTTYYVRGEGTCNTTNCVNTTVTLNTNSTAAGGAIGTPSTICTGLPTTLTLTGGSLGAGSSWVWYSGSCGGTYAGNDSMVTVFPTVTTSYYVRAENVCNSTSCVSEIITVNDSSIIADTLMVSNDTICQSLPALLSLSGGLLGTSAGWYWYAGSCGGMATGNGSTITVYPTVTTGYYLRAEGICNTTPCINLTVTVNDSTVSATGIASGNHTICESSSTTLGVTGGSSGTGADWYWYTGNCGGTLTGNGSTITVSPTVTTVYYLRGEGICNTTGCINKLITVNDSSEMAVSVIPVMDTICESISTTLGVNGGSLGQGADWYWYTGGCGVTEIGNGSALTISPVLTTDYFVRAESPCNTTLCRDVIVTVYDSSVSATGINATLTTICAGNTTTLSFTGGVSGSGAYWSWFTGSCGGNGIGIGSSVEDNPAMTTMYYLRSEGICNTTPCVSLGIIVNTNSSGILTGISSPDTICYGTTTNLVITSGQLGTGGDWYWYSSGCGGTNAGVGSVITVSPSATMDYYVRAEGVCNTTGCMNVHVTVNTNSIQATGITTADSSICEGISSTLGVSGGQLGTGGDWYWYSGSCGGNAEGNGITLTVSPLLTTDYYLRGEGVCNTTNCVMLTITVNDSSVTAGSLMINPDTVCEGLASTLGVAGGQSGTGGDWHWYSGSCGGTPEGIGSMITLNPTITTVYYVRAEGICNTTACINGTLTVKMNSQPVTAIATASSMICPGIPSTLGISGGSLGAGADWYWYSGSCGGAFEGNGNILTISPTVTTDYFVRGEGVCNTTICADITISMKDSSIAGTISTAQPDTVCEGLTTNLAVSGGYTGSNAVWYWYSGSCGGSYVGTGINLVIIPPVTTVYYVRAEGSCNTTGCVNVTVTENPDSQPVTGITGTQTVVCSGVSTTLGITGGSLGTGGDWYWYSGSCGGTLTGNGISQVVTPVSTTVYYVRGEGLCNTTLCRSITIKMLSLAVPPTTLTSSNNGYCSGIGGNIILGASGGYGDVIKWYMGGCEVTGIGSGSSLTIPSPLITTDYYAEWQTNSCGNSSCTSIEVTVIPIPNDPSGAWAQPDTIGTGQSTSLMVMGVLNAGEFWFWYENGCGTGAILGTGTSLEVYPVSSTEYYVRAENGICYSGCTTAMLTIPGSLNNAGQVTAMPSDTVCNGSTTTLGVTNSLNGGSWYWYENGCGGTLIGSGMTMDVQPAIATTYSVRQELGGLLSSCENRIVYVNTLSTAASGINSVSDTLCLGNGTILTITGGSLGTSGVWHWYSGTCGGTPEGTGTNISVIPTITTGYYLRAEGICNTTICVNITITVNDTSIEATDATASQSSICEGSTTLLGITGGYSGSYSDWHWYSGTCGGTSEGMGSTLTVGPPVTTVYYVRSEGICNTTQCSNITITVNDSSSINGSMITEVSSAICSGGSTTLGVSGGLMGTGADWSWYSGTCGGTLIGNGTTLTVSPAVTTVYYARIEGLCNTTLCINDSIIVNANTTLPASVDAVPGTIIRGSGSSLELTGGLLGTGGNWIWYSGSCGGVLEGNGTMIGVLPTITTTYYLRGEGLCNTTSCMTVLVTVNDTSISAVSATSASVSVCPGDSTVLGITGGVLGTGADWYWYDGACGGTPAGAGAAITVYPAGTTTYYVRAEGITNTTGCVNTTVAVNVISVPGTGITMTNDTIHIGDSDTLSLTGDTTGTSAIWNWYSGGCGGTVIGTGLTISVSPTVTTGYYINASGLCNTTVCISEEVVVIQGYTVSGTLMYDQSINILDSVWLYLRSNGNIIDSTETDSLGMYHFNIVPSGTYTITGMTKKLWGGVNSTDAVKVKRHFAGSEYFTTSLRLHAADVNLSGSINTTDAVKITRRFVESDTSFTRGDWDFENPVGGDTLNVSTYMNDTIIVNGQPVTLSLKGICIGDVNGSYVPPLKLGNEINLSYEGSLRLGSGQYFEMPLQVTGKISVGAISLILDYPKDLVDVMGVRLKDSKDQESLYYHVKGGELRIGWFETGGAMSLGNKEPLVILEMRTGNNFSEGESIRVKVSDNSLCELADENGEPIPGVNLKTLSIEHSGTLTPGLSNAESGNEMIIYPNPANDMLYINYLLSRDSKVKIEIYNILGEKVEDLVDQQAEKGNYTKETDISTLSPGVYTCKMILDKNEIIVKRLVISR